MQRYILVLLYLNNKGDGWTNNEKWMTSVHECEWYGVSCHAHGGLVDKLDLSHNNLVGSLPPELGELRGLEHLVRLKLFISYFNCLFSALINHRF